MHFGSIILRFPVAARVSRAKILPKSTENRTIFNEKKREFSARHIAHDHKNAAQMLKT